MGHQYHGLPCIGYGKTAPEAIADFCEMFEVQWAALVECPLEELTSGARRAREALIAFVEEPASL